MMPLHYMRDENLPHYQQHSFQGFSALTCCISLYSPIFSKTFGSGAALEVLDTTFAMRWKDSTFNET